MTDLQVQRCVKVPCTIKIAKEGNLLSFLFFNFFLLFLLLLCSLVEEKKIIITNKLTVKKQSIAFPCIHMEVQRAKHTARFWSTWTEKCTKKTPRHKQNIQYTNLLPLLWGLLPPLQAQLSFLSFSSFSLLSVNMGRKKKEAFIFNKVDFLLTRTLIQVP